MSQFSANMMKPLFSALPEEQRRAFAEWIQEEQKDRSQPARATSNPTEETLHAVADQIGEFYRPGKEEEAISELMFS